MKTRAGTAFGAPVEAVTPAKADRIRNVTRAWLRCNDASSIPVRFDVLSVLWPVGVEASVEHLRGAF